MKVRKIFVGLICAVMAFSMALPVYAEQNAADQARGLVMQCPECFGVVDVIVTKDDLGETWKFCEHMDLGIGHPGAGTGRDFYHVYEITHKENCRNCSYSNINKYTKYVFLRCENGLA